MLKTSGYAVGFQHSPRDLANVNEWKIIFDPYNVLYLIYFKIMGKRKTFSCIYCAGRQQAVHCDGCGEWPHRKCNTGKGPFSTKTHGPCNTQMFFLSSVKQVKI